MSPWSIDSLWSTCLKANYICAIMHKGVWPIYHGEGDVHKHDTTWNAWRQPLDVVYRPYITNHEVPYCYYKLVINVIRAVKIIVLSYPWYTVWYTTAVSQSAFRARTFQFIIITLLSSPEKFYSFFLFSVSTRIHNIPWRHIITVCVSTSSVLALAVC